MRVIACQVRGKRPNIAFVQLDEYQMTIAIENPQQADVVAMLSELDAYCSALYRAESNLLMDVAALTGSNVHFLVARDASGVALGCDALVLRDGYGEIKRMFVDPRHRSQGTGRALLRALAARARECALPLLMLETGVSQPEALSLYEREGFARCAPGDYLDDPLSVFMRCSLNMPVVSA